MAQGLTGSYYNSDVIEPGNLSFTRVDANVDFYDYCECPISPTPPLNYGVVWSGYIVPLYSETYTFTVDPGDFADYCSNPPSPGNYGAANLTINGQMIVNKPSNLNASGPQTGTIALSAGAFYPISLSRSDRVTNFVIGLWWQSASQTKQIVPQSQLSTTLALTATPGYNASPAMAGTLLWPIPIIAGFNPTSAAAGMAIVNRGRARCAWQELPACPSTPWRRG